MISGIRRRYQRWVPAAVRYPIGRLRRMAWDRLLRLRSQRPLPPARLLDRVQMTPWVMEYLSVGRSSAVVIRQALAAHARGPMRRVLDFGCGLSRTLRHCEDASWATFGCDIDVTTVAWSSRAMPFASFVVSPDEAALPYATAAFDAVYAVSVFTHFDEADQRGWADVLARVVRPGGLAVISTMGAHALGSFGRIDTPEHRDRLRQDGFFDHRSGPAFNHHGAFHSADGISRLFAGGWSLVDWRAGGLDGFQDLSVLRRR